MGKHAGAGQRAPLLTDLPLFKTVLASAGVLLTGAGSLAVWAVGEIEHLQHHATVIQQHTDQLSGGLARLKVAAESNAAKAARLRAELATLTDAQPPAEQPAAPPPVNVKQGVKRTPKPSPKVTTRAVPVAPAPVQTAARPTQGPPPPLGLPKLPGLPGSKP